MALFRFPEIEQMSSVITLDGNTRSFTSPFTKAVKTQGRTGERLQARVTIRNLRSDDRDRLQAFLAALNGQENRVFLRDDSKTRRGTIAGVSDLLDVILNATNWVTDNSARGTLSDLDVGVRFTAEYDNNSTIIRPTSSADGVAGLVAGRVYVARIHVGNFLAAGFSTNTPKVSLSIREASTGTVIAQSSAVEVNSKLAVAALCYDTSEFFIRVDGNPTSVFAAGGSFDIEDLQVSRCLMIDNGINELTHSEEFDDGAWIKLNATVSANAAVAPDGTTTADEWIENSDTAQTHVIEIRPSRASVAEYWTGTVYLKKNTRQRIRLLIDDLSLNGGVQFFDADSGTETSTAAVTASGKNPYSSIHDAGNGWYRCRLTVHIPASTTVRLQAQLCEGATNVVSYDGDGTSGLYLWGAQLQRGFAPGRSIQTVASANSGTSQTGTSIWVKGADPDLNNLLRGDLVEIGNHIHMLTQDFRTDEIGSGRIEVFPRVRTAASDEDPVILHKPQGIFMLAAPAVSWRNVPGVFSDFQLDFIQDIAA